MNHRPGPTNANTRSQEAAFQHPDVVRIAQELVATRNLALLRLAKMAIAYPWAARPEDVVGLVRVPTGLEAPALAIADAGLRIATEPDDETKVRRRGALVERLVWELVRTRDAAIERERAIELTENRWSGERWSKPKEIVGVRDEECEVYECKLSPTGIDQDDVNELADIRDTARAEGLTAYSTLATLEAYPTFQSTLGRRQTHGDLHYVTESEVFSLQDAPPAKTIRA